MIDYLCSYNGTPCWIMGTGYRIVTDQCAIDDAVLGKFTYAKLSELTHFSSNTLAIAQANDFSGVTLAPIPLAGAMEYLTAALVTLALAYVLMRFADVDEAIRGPASGRV